MRKLWPLIVGVIVILAGSFYIARAAGCTPFFVASGGTGVCAIVSGTIPYGNGTTKISTSTALTFDGTRLNVTYASSTAISVSGSASTTALVISNTGTGSTKCLHVDGSGTVTAASGDCTTSSGITDLGTGYATSTGPTITLATTTQSFNGLTIGQTITRPNTTQLLFTPTVSGTLTVSGGGTGVGTFTVSQLLYGNGTNALSSVATSSLTFTGPFNGLSTLGALVGGTASNVVYWGLSTTTQPSSSNVLTSNGAAGVYGTATSTLTAGTGLTGSFTQLGSGGSVALSTPVSIANGGTNATSFGTTNGIVAYDATRLVNFAGYTLTSTLLTLTNATTTNLTASQSLNIPSSATQTPTSAGQLAHDTTDNQLKMGTGSATAVFDQRRFYSFGEVGTTTTNTITGTTTIAGAPFPAAMTINSIICTTDVGTVDVKWSYGPTPTQIVYIRSASTTPGTYPITTNNTPGATASSTIVIGTPASSPTTVSCTGSMTVTGT